MAQGNFYDNSYERIRVKPDMTGVKRLKTGKPGRQAYDMTGLVIGRLLIMPAYKTEGGKRQWMATCTCGTVTYQQADGLLSGYIRSCGCLRQENRKRYWDTIRPWLNGDVSRCYS